MYYKIEHEISLNMGYIKDKDNDNDNVDAVLINGSLIDEKTTSSLVVFIELRY